MQTEIYHGQINKLNGRTDGRTHKGKTEHIPSPSEWGIIIQSPYSSVFINWRFAVILCGQSVKINEVLFRKKLHVQNCC